MTCADGPGSPQDAPMVPGSYGPGSPLVAALETRLADSRRRHKWTIEERDKLKVQLVAVEDHNATLQDRLRTLQRTAP